MNPCLRRLAWSGLITSFVSLVCVQAQQPDATARGREALDKMVAAYAALPALHVRVNWTAKYTGSGSADDFPLPGPDRLELRMQRPNKLFMSAIARRDGKTTSYLVVSDGSSLWYWRSVTNTYSQVPAPATLAESPSLLPDDAIGTTDGTTWEVDTIMEWDLLTTRATTLGLTAAAGVPITVTGPEKLGAAQVEVVRVRSPAGVMPFSMENRLYLDVETSLVRGLGFSVRGKHPDDGKDFSVEMQGTYDTLNARPKFSASDFAFTVPAGARKTGASR
jgi:outer membrane lipoprotein-sorting protein